MKTTMETTTVGKHRIRKAPVGKKYHVRIIKRQFDQTSDDYHATVMRLNDGVELVWMATWKWWLKIKIRRGALDRAFKYYDKRKAKGKQVEEFCA